MVLIMTSSNCVRIGRVAGTTTVSDLKERLNILSVILKRKNEQQLLSLFAFGLWVVEHHSRPFYQPVVTGEKSE